MKRTRKINCKNKDGYPNRKAAEAAMYSFYRRNFGGLRVNAEAYRCGDHWHWGHYRNRKR